MQALTKARPSPYFLTDQPMPLVCAQPGQNATQRQSGYSWPLRDARGVGQPHADHA